MSVTKQMFEKISTSRRRLISSRRLHSSSLLLSIKIQLNVGVYGKWAQGNPPVAIKMDPFDRAKKSGNDNSRNFAVGKGLALRFLFALLVTFFYLVAHNVVTHFRFHFKHLPFIHEQAVKASYRFNSSRNDWQGKWRM